MTLTPERAVFSPVHQTALSRMKSIREKVAYACSHGPGPGTDVVREFLSTHGQVTKSRTYVATLVTGYRAVHDLPADTGSLPVLTPEMLKEMDMVRAAAPDGSVLTSDESVPTTLNDISDDPWDDMPGTPEFVDELDATPDAVRTRPSDRLDEQSSQPSDVSDALQPLITAARGRSSRVSVLVGWLIGISAFVAVWSGWVGLGGMTGFGVIHPLPGILDRFTINTSITLPIGLEAYGAFAIRAWLNSTRDTRLYRFARGSAITSIGLGMLGQISYHLMVAAGWNEAPWWITTFEIGRAHV